MQTTVICCGVDFKIKWRDGLCTRAGKFAAP